MNSSVPLLCVLTPSVLPQYVLILVNVTSVFIPVFQDIVINLSPSCIPRLCVFLYHTTMTIAQFIYSFLDFLMYQFDIELHKRKHYASD